MVYSVSPYTIFYVASTEWTSCSSTYSTESTHYHDFKDHPFVRCKEYITVLQSTTFVLCHVALLDENASAHAM